VAALLVSECEGFGLPALEVDGGDVEQVWQAANELLVRARGGEGPGFLHAHCVHLEGHFLGDQLLRAARNPGREMPVIAGPLLRSAFKREGAPAGERASNLLMISGLSQAVNEQTAQKYDPLHRARQKLERETRRLAVLEDEVAVRSAGSEEALKDLPGLGGNTYEKDGFQMRRGPGVAMSADRIIILGEDVIRRTSTYVRQRAGAFDADQRERLPGRRGGGSDGWTAPDCGNHAGRFPGCGDRRAA
jgi:hypothetical protein